METEARYTLIGLFTLAVTAAGFAFVYWLNSVGGIGQRDVYQVRFENTVSGLTRGAGVLFNGIRIGEVTALALPPETPSAIVATISVDRSVPIRADTRASIDFQGLMGAPAVALFGGDSKALPIKTADGAVPTLVADPLAGISMMQTARDAFRRVDMVVNENAEPLRELIANINSFSAALARNAARVDNIAAGLERMTGGGSKPQPHIFDLPAPREIPNPAKIPAGQLIVAEPSSLGVLDTDKVLVRSEVADKPPFANAQWPDLLPKLVQSRLIQGFENAGYLRALGRAPDGVTADYTLLTDLRTFEIVMEPSPTARVEVAGKLMAADGKMIEAKIFKANVAVELPPSGIDAKSGVTALRAAFAEAGTQLVIWACAAL